MFKCASLVILSADQNQTTYIDSQRESLRARKNLDEGRDVVIAWLQLFIASTFVTAI
jgi:hypothetical protein